MESNDILMILVSMILAFALILSWTIIVKDTEDFRKSSEGKCLTKIAKELWYCAECDIIYEYQMIEKKSAKFLKNGNSHQNKNTESSNPIGSSAKTNRDTNGITGSGDTSYFHGNHHVKSGGTE